MHIVVYEQKKRRARAPKNRTGCGTCKIRHKRCDEAKPICDACRETGRICDGYIDPSTGQRYGGNRRRVCVSRPPLVGLVPHTSHLASEEEAQGFRFFETVTTKQLSAALQNLGWTPPVLQLSHHDPTIRHAAIAAGIMSRRYQINELALSPSALECRATHTLYQAALRQYGKAVACFRAQLGARQRGENLPTALDNAPACCVLLIMFEFMQGNVDGLLMHLRSATQLLVIAGRRRSPQIQSYAKLLALIDMVTAMWLNRRSSDSYDTMQLAELSPSNQVMLPAARLSLGSDLEALSSALVDINNDAMIWRHSLASSATRHRRDIWADGVFTTQCERIRSRLGCWYCAFITFHRTGDHHVVSGTTRYALLHANYFLLALLIGDTIRIYRTQCSYPNSTSTQPSPSTACNRHPSPSLENNDVATCCCYFTKILSLVEPVVRDYSSGSGPTWARYARGAGEETLAATGLVPLFSFRLSFIQPLFYVAQAAPDPRLRQRAIGLLLETPWREGAWDSFVLGSVAKRAFDGDFPHAGCDRFGTRNTYPLV